MYKKIYPTLQTYIKYGENKYLVFDFPRPAKYQPTALRGFSGLKDGKLPERPEPVDGWEYEGDHPTGAYLIDATEASYPAFVSGMIRKKYSADQEAAVKSNAIKRLMDEPGAEDTDGHGKEWVEFEAYRMHVKNLVRSFFPETTEE